MNNFSNLKIAISDLPQFEKLQLQPIEKNYFKIIMINIILVFTVISIGLASLYYFDEGVFQNRFWLIIGILIPVLFSLIVLMYYFSFRKRGYAFREQDAVYKSGLISETTTIVPFKRIQHVALHQGLFSRFFGLASLELFTAGGSSTDLHISGLLLEDAQRYKIWIVEKIDVFNEQDGVVGHVSTNKLDSEVSFDASANSDAHED